jgi:hypothetical protein
MGIVSFIPITALIVLVCAVLLQEYLVIRNKRALIAIELRSDETKWSFGDLKEEKFEIEYSQNDWDYLLQKLNNTRYFSPLKQTKKFEFGFNIDYAKEMVEYWKTGFNWKTQVNKLNKYSHYRIKFNDLTLHYIRVNDNNNNNNSKLPVEHIPVAQKTKVYFFI